MVAVAIFGECLMVVVAVFEMYLIVTVKKIEVLKIYQTPLKYSLVRPQKC